MAQTEMLMWPKIEFKFDTPASNAAKLASTDCLKLLKFSSCEA